jgi:plasmid stabilization system protein ParE
VRFELGETAGEDLERIRHYHRARESERHLARLLAFIQASIEGICAFPEAWPEREPGIRKRVLRKHPCVILNAVDHSRQVVVVLRIAHQHQEY